MREAAAVAALVRESHDALGGLDIVVANAGNAIASGLIATDSADAMGSADEVAPQLAVYLASDDAAWVTGEIYRIDGGQG